MADLTVKIYGTRGGVADHAAMQANAQLLPPQTQWIAIEGVNHVQFGYYRHQLGDDPAMISREAQQGGIVAGAPRSASEVAVASPPAVS